MELLSQIERNLKEVSYIVRHEGAEYTITDLFEEGKIRETIIRNKDGEIQHDGELFEELTSFLDETI